MSLMEGCFWNFPLTIMCKRKMDGARSKCLHGSFCYIQFWGKTTCIPTIIFRTSQVLIVSWKVHYKIQFVFWNKLSILNYNTKWFSIMQWKVHETIVKVYGETCHFHFVKYSPIFLKKFIIIYTLYTHNINTKLLMHDVIFTMMFCF